MEAILHDPAYGADLLKSLADIRSKQLDYLYDIKIIVNADDGGGGYGEGIGEAVQVIMANKFILAASSKSFYSIIIDSPLDASDIIVQDMDPEALQMLVDFMYTGNLLITSKNVVQLLSMANKLQMPAAIALCKQFMELLSNMPAENNTTSSTDVDKSATNDVSVPESHTMTTADANNDASGQETQQTSGSASSVATSILNPVKTETDADEMEVVPALENIQTSGSASSVATSILNPVKTETDAEEMEVVPALENIQVLQEADDNGMQMTKTLQSDVEVPLQILSADVTVKPESKLVAVVKNVDTDKVISKNPKNFGNKQTPKPNDGKLEKRCNYCNLLFKYSHECMQHHKRHALYRRQAHRTARMLVVTGTSGTSEKQSHLHAVGKRLGCPKCKRNFSLHTSCKRHIDLCISGRHRCQKCSKRFRSRRRLAKHMAVHECEENYQIYKCETCARRFKNLGCLINHAKSKHSDDKSLGEELMALEGDTVIYDLDQGLDQVHVCSRCGVISYTEAERRQHEATHRPKSAARSLSKRAKPFTKIVCDSTKVLADVEAKPLCSEDQIDLGLEELAAKIHVDETLLRLLYNGEMKTIKNVYGLTAFLCYECCIPFSHVNSLALHLQKNHSINVMDMPIMQAFPKPKRFYCIEPGCEQGFSNTALISTHMKQCHPGVVYRCDLEGCLAFATYIHSYLIKHKIDGHHDKTCDKCNKTFKTAERRLIHDATIHKEESPLLTRYECKAPGCSYVSYTEPLLMHHSVQHLEQKAVACEVCNRMFKNKPQMMTHMSTIHGIKKNKEQVMMVSDLNRFVTQMEKDGQSVEMIEHMVGVAGETDAAYKCDLCEFECKSHVALVVHRERDHNIKQDQRYKYECDICHHRAISFKNLCSHKLRKHGELSPGVKQFVCPTCNYVCYSNCKLQEHIKKLHSLLANMPCPKCSKSFKTSQQLSDHQRMVHPKYKYLCPHCQYSSPLKSAIHKHMISMHTHPQIRPYQCKYCDFTHTHAGSIHAHSKTKHKGMPPKYIQLCKLPRLSQPLKKVYLDGSGVVQ